MTQPTLNFTETPHTYRDRLAAFLQARPGQWVDGLQLAQMAGAYAWRTRLSELRTQLGLTVENRQYRVGRRVVSEYRYIERD